MRSYRIMFGGTLVATAALVHCSSTEMLDPVLDDAAVDAAVDSHRSNDTDASGDELADATSDGGSDAASLSDADVEEPYEIPDGSVTCATTPCAVSIAVSEGQGSPTFCARMSDGTVQCWGANTLNRLGAPESVGTQSTVPLKVENLSGVTSLSLGGKNACAVRSDGSVWCWGAAALLYAGLGPDAGAGFDPDGGAPSALPTALGLVPSASTVGVGDDTACITTAAGALHCWGNNATNQLGQRAPAESAPPGSVSLGSQTAVAARPTTGRTFAITGNGQLWSWGSAGCTDPLTCQYLLGRASSEDPDPTPTRAPSLKNVFAIGSGSAHSCAVAGKLVECWGANTNGHLGIGTVDETRTLPVPSTVTTVAHDEDVDAGLAGNDVPLDVAAAADGSATCAVMVSGRVYCWGWPTTPAADRGRPIRVDGFSGPAVAVAVTTVPAASTACALLRSGAVECWGVNLFGALGRGNSNNRLNDPVPAPVVFSQP